MFSFVAALFMGVVAWSPVNVAQFWTEPNRPATIQFEAKDNSERETEYFIIRTTDGEELKSGEGKVEKNRLTLEVDLPQGYYELELPNTGQTFGLASQPAYCQVESKDLKNESKGTDEFKPIDPFFAIDAASTWLVQNDQAREELFCNAKRIGIATYRERVNWGAIEPQEGNFDFQGDRRSEFVRTLATKYDLPILELFHNAPEWTGNVGKYPEDLIKTSKSWSVIGKRWEQYWNSLEVWNEPDISFSGNLPADQYVPVLKTLAYTFRREHIQTPIVGGIIALYQSELMDSLARNGALDACDIFSFHTYCRAPEMETVSLRFCEWMKRNNSLNKPVWITECGRPWKKGTDRPNREADLESAIDIVQKGVAAKALGIDAYFPFVYVYYEENDNNFGMSDYSNAPLRSCAGYARAIYLLSGKRCVGSWKLSQDAPTERSYLFVDPDTKERVAVLYAHSRAKGRRLRLPCEPERVERITGERLEVSDDLSVDFSDGFLFVFLPNDFEAELAEQSAVDKMREDKFRALFEGRDSARRNDSIVMRFDYDAQTTSVSSGGYSLKNPDLSEYCGQISVFNLGDEDVVFSIAADACSSVDGVDVERDLFIELPKSIKVPARGRATFDFVVNASKISPFNGPILNFRLGENSAVLSFRISRAASETSFRQFVREFFALDLSNQDSWRRSLSSNGEMDFIGGLQPRDASSRRLGMGFVARFSSDADRWAYPVFSLPLAQGSSVATLHDSTGGSIQKNLADFKGIAFRVRGVSNEENSVLRFFTYRDGRPYYYTAAAFAKADGKERFIAIPFESLNPYEGAQGAFDPSLINAISIGCNSKGSETEVKVGEFYFYK